MKTQKNKIKPVYRVSYLKYYIFISLFFLLYPLVLFSQTPILYGPPGSRTIDLYVNSKDPSIIYTSNYQGGLFKSFDFGRSVDFEISIFPSNPKTNIFYSIQNKKLFTFAGTYLVSKKENELTWKLLFDVSNYAPRVKHFVVNPSNEKIIYMPINSKEIWRSNNEGENWYLLHTFENDIDIIAIAPSDSSVLYAASGIDLYKSTDSGKNWTIPFVKSFAFDAYQLKVNPQNPNSIYLQSGGYLFHAFGSGDNVDTIAIFNLSDYIIDPKDTLVMYVAASDPYFGTDGGIMKTIDGGKSWFDITNGLPLNGQTVEKLAIDQINTKTVYAGTSSNGVFKTNDGGENWDLTNLVSDGNVYNYEVLDSKKGSILVSSFGWHLVKTIDGGKSWNKASFFPIENNWNTKSIYTTALNPNDKNIGYHGDGVNFFKTVDGGSTWIVTDNLPGCIGVIYHKFNTNLLFAIDINLLSYISYDGGEKWNNLSQDGIPVLFSSLNENIGYFISSEGINKSIDNGITWTSYSDGLLRYKDTQELKSISSIDIVDNNPQILYCSQMAAYENVGGLSKSINGGESWFQVDSALSKFEPMLNISNICVDQENPNRLFIGLEDYGSPYIEEFKESFSIGSLYLTEDGCKTWRKIFDSYSDNIKIDYTTTPKIIYFTTKFGLMSLPDTAHVTEVEKNNNPIPTKFELYQNYPNPFNPSTTIKYEIPSSTVMLNSFQHPNNSEIPNNPSADGREDNVNVKLVVYDILGREIATLVNEEKQPGTYEVKFDGTNLPSGLYFYRLQSGEFIQTNKMLLLK